MPNLKGMIFSSFPCPLGSFKDVQFACLPFPSDSNKMMLDLPSKSIFKFFINMTKNHKSEPQFVGNNDGFTWTV